MKIFLQIVLIVSLVSCLVWIVGKKGIASLGIGGYHIPASTVEKIVGNRVGSNVLQVENFPTNRHVQPGGVPPASRNTSSSVR